MNIVVFGATGMVGSRTVAEAESRGHQVTGYARHGEHALDFAETAKVVDIINDPAVDVTIIAVVSGRTGSYDEDIANHQALIDAAPTGRLLIVGGAGALQADDNSLLVDAPDFPEMYKPESQTFVSIYNMYKQTTDLNWTMLAPAPEIAPGERTGQYQVAKDHPAGRFISAEDFAVALVDEAENPQHAGTRFTVAN